MMKKKYGRLFNSIDKLISVEAQDIQDWKSLEVLFRFLQGHTKMMINKETNKPYHFKKKSNKNRPLRRSERDDEEDKVDKPDSNPQFV